MRDFKMWLLEQRYASTTIDQYVRYVRRAARDVPAGRGRSLRRATEADLRWWLSTLPVTADSWNGSRKALHAFYRSTGRRPNPVNEIETVPTPQRLPRPLSDEDHIRFLAASHALGGKHQIIGVLFATTAVRFAGLQRARWAQFELRGSAPVWRIAGKGARRRGPKEYQVPLHSAVVPIVRAWRAQCGSAELVLPGGARGGWISDTKLRRLFAEIVATAELEGRIVPHMLRHTVATAALDLCGDITKVRDLLGQASVATTQIYTQVSPARLRDLVEALPA